MATIFKNLEALLPGIQAAQSAFDDGYQKEASRCRGADIEPLAAHYARFNAVLEKAFEAVCEDTRAVNNRSSLAMIFTPKHPLDLYFYPRGCNAHHFLSEVVRTNSFNPQVHADQDEATSSSAPAFAP